MKKYPIGEHFLPEITDGGVYIKGSVVGIYKDAPIPRNKGVAGVFGAVYTSRMPENKTLFLDTVERTLVLGREIARLDLITLTGATAGIPHHAAYAASSNGGVVVGYSPSGNSQTQLADFRKRYDNLFLQDELLVRSWDKDPISAYNLILYLNLTHRNHKKNQVQRDVFTGSGADISFLIDGRYGTAHEGVIGREIGSKVVAVLLDSGGLSQYLGDFLTCVEKDTNVVVLTNRDPEVLIKQAYDEYLKLKQDRKIGSNETFYRFISEIEQSIVNSKK